MITEGDDIAIIATGLMVAEARIAAEQLAAEGIHARVINMPHHQAPGRGARPQGGQGVR